VIFTLPSTEIDSYWNHISPHLYRLQRRGYIDVEEVREDLKSQAKQLWAYEEGGKVLGVCITRITKGRVCEFYGAVGTQSRPGQIQEVHDAIVAWAKSINCTKLRFNGRVGWLRLLKGYEQTGVIAEKEL
jgi:hypothetical protein